MAEPGYVLRQRPVLIDADALRQAASLAEASDTKVELELFSDVTLLVDPNPIIDQGIDEARKPDLVYGSWSWSGRVVDAAGQTVGSVSLAVTEANGLNRPHDALAARVLASGREFDIMPAAGPVHLVREVDADAPVAATDPSEPRSHDDADSPSAAQAGETEVAEGGSSGITTAATTIDVLAVFATGARVEVGDIGAVINLEVGHANAANNNSGAGAVRFRLAGVREVNYTPTNMLDDLDHLIDPSNGVLDFVHLWRTQTGADLVVLFVTGDAMANNICGIAKQMSQASYGAAFAPYAFSVVDVDRTNCKHHVMAHEMGHNLALRHDWDNSNGNGSPFTYNHGHVSGAGDFSTVMAYPSSWRCPGGSCTAIPHWSSPYVTYNGHATGVPEGSSRAAENYRALLNGAPHAAGWRSGPSGTFANAPYWLGWDIAEDLHHRRDDVGGYVLDGWGSIHARGGAPPAGCPCPYWGWDIARALDVVPSSVSGVTLDGWGGIHKWGSAAIKDDIKTNGNPYWNGWDIARGAALAEVETCELLSCETHYGGVTLDGWGGIHKWGGATPSTSGAPYWNGTDIARGVAVRSAGGGYTLDGFGGIHRWGGAPAVSGNTYYQGADWFRGLSLNPSETGGHVIDRYGGIYPFNAF